METCAFCQAGNRTFLEQKRYYVTIRYVSTRITLQEKGCFRPLIYVVRKDKHGDGKGEMMLWIRCLEERKKESTGGLKKGKGRPTLS